MYLVKSLSRDKGSGRYTMYLPLLPCRFLGAKGQIHCVSARALVPREGLYQIHGQSLNTHRGKHRSGGARKCKCECNQNGIKFQNNLRVRVIYLHPTVEGEFMGEVSWSFCEISFA